MKKSALLLAILMLMIMAVAAQAEPLCITSEEEFLSRLQAEVGAANKAEVIKLIYFPLRTSKGNIKNAKALIEKYDYIFNPGVVQAIKMARFEELFSRDQGSMIGNGEVWFNNFRQAPCFKVITINDDLGRPARSSP